MRAFGLIGYPLGHSFSKGFFTEKFQREKIDAQYENYPSPAISDFPELLARHPQLEGLNVTIPYKEQVIPYLDELSPVVAAIGACNCIRIQHGRLIGYNTDVVGFEQSLRKKLQPDHRKALVLGTGGASKAVQYVMRQLQIDCKVVSRNADPAKGIAGYDQLTRADLQEATLWINTTPLGMYPNTESAPPLDYSQVTDRHYLYDLVYNPPETRFLALGKARGATVENGHDMLIIQALESWRIWNS
jgi:shikimate dehydrogenase